MKKEIKKEIERIDSDITIGLTKEMVDLRIENGYINKNNCDSKEYNIKYS